MGALGDVYVCDSRAGCLQYPGAGAGPATRHALALVGVVARRLRLDRSSTQPDRQSLGLPEGAEKLPERQQLGEKREPLISTNKEEIKEKKINYYYENKERILEKKKLKYHQHKIKKSTGN